MKKIFSGQRIGQLVSCIIFIFQGTKEDKRLWVSFLWLALMEKNKSIVH